MPVRDDLTGEQFASLTVLAFSGMRRRRSHWRCRCVCGREVFVDGSKLRNGHTRSCGCIRRGMPQPSKRKAYGEALRNRIIWQYKANAKSRGVPYSLTLAEVEALFSSDCFYCGRPPSTTVTRKGHWGEFTYNGIDRIDNARGYEQGNVLPCCMECNFKRGAQPQEDFLAWIRAVARHQGWDGRSSGTAHMMSEARRAGIPVEVVT